MKQIFTRIKLILPAVCLIGTFAPLTAQNCFDVGTGADGAFLATSNTLLPGGTYNYTTFTINSGVTVGVSGTQPLIIRCTGAVIINGTLRANGGNGTDGITFSAAGTGGIGVGGGADGGAGSYSSSVGPLPGTAGAGSGGVNNQGGAWSGGGGSGYVAVGGSTLNAGNGMGGPIYGTADLVTLTAGSGGGGGSGGYSCGSGGGGAGGGLIYITAGGGITISATGAITCNGGNGGSDGTGNCGGGGGGSGGSIWLASASITNNGTMTCNGGTGGASNVNYSPYWGMGATGSAGRIRLDYNGTISGSGTTSPSVGFHQGVPVTPFSTAISGTNILCNGNNNGTAVTTALGGVSPYTYAWSPSGGNASSATGLGVGTYSCVITDATGCTHTETVSITEPTAISATVTATNVDCNGDATGTASIVAAGGTPSYSYAWSSGGTAATETGLTAGTYTCTITDGNACTLTQTVTVTQPSPFDVVTSVTDASQCGGIDGAIDVAVTGGTPGYTYLWSNAATTQDLTGISAGTYALTITDANGCTTQITEVCNNPANPNVTFTVNQDTVCQSTQIPFTLSGGTPAGGIYSGPGVTAGVFDPAQASIGFNVISYAYTDPNTNCSVTGYDSIWVDICNGIYDLSSAGFSVNPNPTNGTFMITLKQNQTAPVMIEITNAIGQQVSSFMMNSSQKEVDLSAFDNGVYLVRITNQDSSAVMRVVKQ